MLKMKRRIARVKARRPSSGAFAKMSALAIVSALVLASAPGASPASHGGDRPYAARRASKGPFCGFDPHGGDEQLFNHRANARRLGLGESRSGLVTQILSTQILSTQTLATQERAAQVRRDGDIALIEDNGTIVMPPSKFDLKNSTILFTPEGDGYRVGGGDVDFSRDLGFKLNYFFGSNGDLLAGSDDGHREVRLTGPAFPFYGTFYETIFVGTNGYITFTGGDVAGRSSATSLATELPRIAALWADLDVTSRGGVYYNRIGGRHIITWDAAPEFPSGGASTFQISLYDDGRIAFVYRKIKARTALVGISPGSSEAEALPVDFSQAPGGILTGPFCEVFSKQKRLDLPGLTRAFYGAYGDEFDTLYLWTDFDFDNGLGVAHSFNVRNDIRGIGIKLFDRGSIYGSPSRLSTLLAMGDIAHDWPADPQAHMVGLNTAISIVCHEQGHRWLSYVRFNSPDHDVKDDLLGRDRSHWSFLVDTRTTPEGNFSSLMEGNAWREGTSGTFTTAQTAVNYFSLLDQYLMGLLPPEEVPAIPYLDVDDEVKSILRSKSPLLNFSLSAGRKSTNASEIILWEGPRVPSASDAPKSFRVAFVLLSERGSQPSRATVDKVDRYRSSIERYFSVATDRRGSLDSSLGSPAGRSLTARR
ncbi:MAG TPA: hypothetical protein VKC34_08650 [Blastocatellia bacterium]|nr:hypothetical protein [Blastocatellia bacterium]